MRISDKNNGRDDRLLDTLESRNVTVLRSLAKDVIRRGRASRLATSTQYQEELEAGSGTIQKAFHNLERLGAMSLRPRGHQGTFIADFDLSLLWSIAGMGAIRIILTPAGSVDGYGLVRGLSQELRRLGVPLEVIYARGASTRLREVERQGADAAVVSAGAIDLLDEGTFTAVELGPDTYYSSTSLGVLTLEGQGKIERVAIDRSSSDHEQLTRAEFPEERGFQYVDCDFVSVPRALLDGSIDAGVWHKLVLVVPLELMGLRYQLLRTPEGRRVHSRLSTAVLVFRRDAPEIGVVFRQLNAAAITESQRNLRDVETDPSVLDSLVWAR